MAFPQKTRQNSPFPHHGKQKWRTVEEVFKKERLCYFCDYV